MTASCILYGLGISLNHTPAPLQNLPPAHHIDVEIAFGQLPSAYLAIPASHKETVYSSETIDSVQDANLTVRRIARADCYEFVYGDGTVIVVDCPGTKIWAEGAPSATLEDTATYVLGPVMGFVLRLRGQLCLHASSVNIDGHAVAFLGQPGAGKSTTAARFAAMGFSTLTDDVAALQEQGDHFLLQPGYPRLNLWPESSLALYGSTEALPAITPGWDKRFLDLTRMGHSFQSSPLPLAAIYQLECRCTSIAAPAIQPVGAASALISLTANSSTNYLLDITMRHQEFDILSRLAARIHFRSVTPLAAIDDLPRLCDMILDDVRSLHVSHHSCPAGEPHV